METIAAARNSKFAKLWASQGLSLVAQNLLNFALINRVYELAQGTRFANISVALLILSFGVPSIFLASAAGIYVDVWDRRKVMVITNLLRAVLALGYLFVEHNLALVLILTFAIASLTQFFAPAESAAIPRLVEPKYLLSANSLFIFTFYASFIVGYSSSPLVISLFGPHGPYYLTSVMFGLATIMDFLLPAIPAAGEKLITLRRLYSTTKKAMVGNWRTIRSNHNLYFPIIQLTVVQSVLGIVLALSPALSLALLHKELPKVSQYLIIPTGLGMVLGVAAVGSLTRYFSKLSVVVTGMVAGGISLGLLGLSGQLYRHVDGHQIASVGAVSLIVAALALLLGGINAVVSSTAQTLLQEHSPEADRGKIFGALLMLINIAATAPVLFAGVLADTFSPTKVIDALGLLVFGFALAQLFWLDIHGHTSIFKKTS